MGTRHALCRWQGGSLEPLAQGAVAARLEMAPAAVPALRKPSLRRTDCGAQSLSRGADCRAGQGHRRRAAGLRACPPMKRPRAALAGADLRAWPATRPQDPSTCRAAKAPSRSLSPNRCVRRTFNLGVGREAESLEARGGWKLAAEPDGQGAGERDLQARLCNQDWLAATVPGTVLTTMIDRGIYPDPDYGLNNLAIPESLAHQDYWYRVEFTAPCSRADSTSR
jgi:hypothetical protein